MPLQYMLRIPRVPGSGRLRALIVCTEVVTYDHAIMWDAGKEVGWDVEDGAGWKTRRWRRLEEDQIYGGTDHYTQSRMHRGNVGWD
jgi:hypothetical protein